MSGLIWLITGRCNVACPHCYASRLRGSPEMNTEECLRVVREAAELGVTYIGFAGGEPLLRRDLLQLMEEASDLGVEVGLVTNGTLLTEHVAERLARVEAHVTLSVDGDRVTHESRRGPGSWRYVERAVNSLRRAGYHLHTITAVGSDNWPRFREGLEALDELGVGVASLIPVMPSGEGASLAVGRREWIAAMTSAWEFSRESGMRVSFWCTPFAPIVLPVDSWSCRRSDTVDLDPSGNLLLCDVLDVRLSSVRGRSLAEAWREADSHPLSKRVSQPRLREPCLSCPIREHCLGGCYARSLLAGQGPDGPDPLCPAASGERP